MAVTECPRCKARLDPSYAFCPECGSPVAPARTAAPQAPAPGLLDDQGTLEAARRPDLSAARPESRPKTGARFRVIRLARGGGHSAEYDLLESGLTVGRGGADIAFPDDLTVSVRHVHIRPVGNRVEVRDLGSTNGVYVRIRAEHRLTEGDQFICGDSVFRVSLAPSGFDAAEYRLYVSPQEKTVLATVTRVLSDGSDGEVWPVRGVPFMFGREEGDVRCGADRFMSRKHAVIQMGAAGLVLVDMKSRNGTYVRRKGDLALGDGDVIMVGRQLLRFEALAS